MDTKYMFNNNNNKKARLNHRFQTTALLGIGKIFDWMT